MEVLLLQIDEHRFGVRTEYVKEVVRAAKLAPLPQPSNIIQGILNLRGQLMPVLNTRALFGIELREILHTDHYIVLETGGHFLTLHVDGATDLVRLQHTDVQSSESLCASSEFVTSLGKLNGDVVHVLAVDQLIHVGTGTLVDTTQEAS